MEPTADEPILLGISSCLLGENVRFDGGHKLNRFIRDTLGQYVSYVSVCPEVESGMTVPRESVRLVQPKGERLKLVAPKSGTDYTASMERYSRKRIRDLTKLPLCGYILKKGSPSCGMERVRVYPRVDGGAPKSNGRGAFAQMLMEKLPHLPVEEDGRLFDPHLRENFIVRVFAYRRLRNLFKPRWTYGQVVEFHAGEKMLLLAHDRPGYTRLGQLVASGKKLPRAEFREQYTAEFLKTLAVRSTRRKHTNVLQHIAGHFKKSLDAGDRKELTELIGAYRAGDVPLIVPVVLLNHHVRRHDMEYLAKQSYLSPHPRKLMLLNHV